MIPGRCCRAVRAAVFAATCGLLAALGHVLMSGTSVPWWAMAPALAGAGAAGWSLAGRERGVLAVTSVAVLVQAALHGGFSLAQAAAARSSGTETGSLTRAWVRHLLCGAPDAVAAPLPATADALHLVTRAGHGGPAHLPPGTADAALTGAAHAHHTATALTQTAAPAHDMSGASSGGMLAAHLLAALLCGLWLAYGEKGTFRMLRAGAGWLLAPLRLVLRLPAPPHRPRVRPYRECRTHPLLQLLLDHTVTSRGPPPGTAVL
ncbi:hypothetical protein [Streptomyces xanthophaeus]|uniref:hypothetical protein n=1 Tax=Streptomyces xanthophaeus TaxID=67385 RepID=UPI0004CD6C03|nr:hypothetical protein [Streptomyces xanthophaeus]